MQASLAEPRSRAALIEGGRAAFKPAMLFMCVVTGLVASSTFFSPPLIAHALLQLVLVLGWGVAYRRMLDLLVSGADDAAAWHHNHVQTALYVLWLEDCTWCLDAVHPAVGSLFLMMTTVGYAFNTASYFYDEKRFLGFLLGTVAGGSVLIGGLGLLTHPPEAGLLAHPSALFVAKLLLTTGLMAMVFSMHGSARRELNRRLDEQAAQATQEALGRQERDIAARTANLLGVGAGAGLFSHDVAGPITALNLALEELQEQATPTQRPALDTLACATREIQLLARDMVFALRGTRQARPVDEIVELVRRQLRFRQAQLPQGLDLAVAVDQQALDVDALFTQALANLIANGARFSPGGRVALEGRVAEDGGYTLRVRDWGVEGPARERALQRIAEALHSEGGVSPDAAAPGTASRGVGLWLVGASVRRLGGSIEARAAAGAGIEVVLRLPPTVEVGDAAGGHAPAGQAGAA